MAATENKASRLLFFNMKRHPSYQSPRISVLEAVGIHCLDAASMAPAINPDAGKYELPGDLDED